MPFSPDVITRVGVACLVVRDGRLLLMRRRGSHGSGTWSTPGGHLDPGETLEACAIRETREETRVRVERVRFVAITNDVFEADARHYVTVWMLAEAHSGEAEVGEEREMYEVGWFPLRDLPDPLFLSLENLLAGRRLPDGPLPPELEP